MKNQPAKLEYLLTTSMLALIVVLNLQILYQSWSFTTDDAYISWRYAESLVQGHGFRWFASNEVIEGYSNFLWVIIAAIVMKLGLPLIITMKYVAISCLFLAYFYLYRIARLFLSPLAATLPVYLFSYYQGVSWWTMSGLETSLYFALVLLLTWLVLRAFDFNNSSSIKSSLSSFRANYWLGACLVLTLVSLTRFEGAIWAVVITGFIGCHCYKKRVTSQQASQLLKITLFAFIIPYSLYFIWRLSYFGHLFPNSYSCKIRFDYYQFYLIKDYLIIAFPCLIVGLPYLMTCECRSILLWFPSIIYCLLLWRADPIIAHFNRLFLAPFSLLSVMAVLGVDEFLSWFSLPGFRRAFINTVVILLFTYFFIPGINVAMTQLEMEHYQQRVSIRLQVTAFLNQRAAPNARVLLSDCGLIPFTTRKDIEFIDSECLNNSDMTSDKINLSSEKYANYLQTTVKPDWVIRNFYPRDDSEDKLTEILNNNGFFNNYDQVTTFQSHQVRWEHGKIVKKQVDHVYKIYQCRPSFCKK